MKKSLFDIRAEWRGIENALVESEGELTPEIEAALFINESELHEKADAYAWIISELSGKNDTIANEIDRLQNLKRSHDSAIKRLKANLLAAVHEFGKFETGYHKFSTRKSSSVVVHCEPESLPEPFQKLKTTISADKTAIKQAFKDGQPVPNCEVVENESLSIK